MIPIQPSLWSRPQSPCLLVDRPHVSKRLILLVHIAAQLHGSLQSVSDFSIHVTAEIPAVIVQRTALVGAFLLHIAQIKEIAYPLRTTIHTNVILLLRYIIIKQFVGPVGTSIVLGTIFHHLLPCIFRRGTTGIVSAKVIIRLLVDQQHMVGCRSCFRHI